MNDNKKTKTKTTKAIIAAAAIMAVVASAAMVFGIQTQMSQYALAQTYGTTAASAAGSASNPVMVNPSQTTNKEFWINTVHLDGATSLHAACSKSLKCTEYTTASSRDPTRKFDYTNWRRIQDSTTQ